MLLRCANSLLSFILVLGDPAGCAVATPEDQGLALFREREHAGWQKLAGGYDAYFQELVVQAIEPLLDAVGVAAGTRLLDLCCGPGYVAARALQRGVVPVGVDFSGAMIALARRHYPNIYFLEGDAELLRFPDGTFNAVVLNFGLHHLAQLERAMGEVARVLRPGGRVGMVAEQRWPPEDFDHRTATQQIVRVANDSLRGSNLDASPPSSPGLLFLTFLTAFDTGRL